jgi:hypothetical protein
MNALLKALSTGILKLCIMLVLVSLLLTTIITLNVNTILDQTVTAMYEYASPQAKNTFETNTRAQCQDISSFQNCTQQTYTTFLSFCEKSVNKTADIQQACTLVSTQSWEQFCQNIDATKKTCHAYLNGTLKAQEFFSSLITNQLPNLQNKTQFAQTIQSQFPQLSSVTPLITTQTPSPPLLIITLLVLIAILWLVERSFAKVEKEIGYMLVTQSLIAIGIFCATYIYIQFATIDTSPILESVGSQTVQNAQAIQTIALSLVPIILNQLYTIPILIGFFGALMLGATLVTVAKKMEKHEKTFE